MQSIIAKKQEGYIAIVLVVFALLIGLMIFPQKFPKKIETTDGSSEYCRPDPPGAAPVTLQADAMDEGWGTIQTGVKATYTRVKRDVPIDKKAINDVHALEGELVDSPRNYRIYYTAPVTGKTINQYLPHRVGQSEQFYWVGGFADNGVSLGRYGVIYGLHVDAAGLPEKIHVGENDYYLVDIFKDQAKPDLPEEVYQCLDLSEDGQRIGGSINTSVKVPFQAKASPNDQLQLEWILFERGKFLVNVWWYPVCKPAVYLYPPTKTLVNVKVFPDGYLTYVDPPYDKNNGWTVTAYPDGKLEEIQSSQLKNKSYDYLYYESKIHDEALEKPEKGWVVKGAAKGQISGEMGDLFDRILPEMGLNQKQASDFTEYWKKALPESPYYFVGIVNQENVDQMERLEISPKPDSVNRVRIYFERLERFKTVEAPEISAPNLGSGFRVVEWGGMVKNDLNHPFTCSQ